MTLETTIKEVWFVGIMQHDYGKNKMKVIECDQLDETWFSERRGSIGGSSISSVMAKGQGKTRKTLMYRLIGEILSDESYDGYQNAHMIRGQEMEPDARSEYEFITGIEVEQVGLVKETSHKHYSPDGCLGDNGLIEIKCVIPSVQVETILSHDVPAAYRKQIQWGLHICQRSFCDFISYSPSVSCTPLFVKRVRRDEKLIKELDMEADKFIGEMLNLIKDIKYAL